jgi:hypothetical protein
MQGGVISGWQLPAQLALRLLSATAAESSPLALLRLKIAVRTSKLFV